MPSYEPMGHTKEDVANAVPPTHDYTDALNNYKRWWPLPDGATGPQADEARKKREANANQIAIDYYDLVSPSYELGWSQQFHYCPFTPGLSINESLIEYEKVIGRLTGLKEGMKVLDVGCGIAGPARTMAKTFNVKVVGITNSPWHVQRGRQLNEEAGLTDKVEVVQGDFNHLPFDDNTFDAAYAFESICYAPDVTVVYKELHRVLKPNAPFGLHEWVMTEAYDASNKKHRVIHDQIERGNGLAKMPLISDVRDGLKESGFITTYEEMMEARSKPGPWYFPLLGMVSYTTCKADFWKTIVMERKVMVPLIDCLYWMMAKAGKVPEEFLDGFQVMKTCTKSVAMGSKVGIFSPMALFVSKNAKQMCAEL